MTGKLPQLRQPSKRADPFLPGLLSIINTAQFGERRKSYIFIQLTFTLAQHRLQRDLGSRRQFFQYFILGPPKNERANQTRQRLTTLVIFVPFDWISEPITEAVP